MTAARDERGLVVAPQFEAAHEGACVLSAGGNAADALVTAALVQGVADPHRCGIGGFGCATVSWGAEALAFDFLGRAGLRCHTDQWADILEGPAPDGFGYVVKGKVNDVGYQSITTPGTVAGIAAIHDRFGSLPWSELVERAAVSAERGFLVTPGLAEFWVRPGLFGRVSTRDRLGHTEYGRSIALDECGAPLAAGARMRLPDLAATYRVLAHEGAASFYTGSLAATMAADWTANGALVTAEDLASYRVRIAPPLEGRFRDRRVLTSPLPAGGTALLQGLALVERESVRQPLNSPEYISRLGSILKAVWADRLAHHGDPDFQRETAADFLSKDHLDGLATAPPTRGQAESPDTTQLSIVDRDGNAISFSHSLGYGSGVFTEGLGFMYNNCMSAYDPRPGFANSIEPGKARSTAIAETILRRGDTTELVLGSPGAARITAAVLEVIVGVVDYGLSAAEAVLQPRFDAYGERTLSLESRFALDTIDALRKRGWEVQQSAKPFGVIGRVYAIGRSADGALVGGVDPGEPGAAVREW